MGISSLQNIQPLSSGSMLPPGGNQLTPTNLALQMQEDLVELTLLLREIKQEAKDGHVNPNLIAEINNIHKQLNIDYEFLNGEVGGSLNNNASRVFIDDIMQNYQQLNGVLNEIDSEYKSGSLTELATSCGYGIIDAPGLISNLNSLIKDQQ